MGATTNMNRKGGITLLLRELRKKAGMSMKELGKYIGVSESTISKYETGVYKMDYETLLRLSEFFGVSVEYLVNGQATEKGLPPKPLSDEEIMFALWGDAEEMRQKDLDDVRAYAQFLRERKKNNG